jgi:CDP-6-deoxy-D-xylo-4-hexulose-3-dehydrase
MKNSNYPLASTTWDVDEIQAMQEVINSGKFTMGNKVSEFESKFANLVGAEFAVMVNSGSSANLAMLTASKFLKRPLLCPGDEVIVPAVSWSTTFYPIEQIGCVLSFVDIDLHTLNIDPTKIIEAITPKTKAILVVNLLGNPANWTALNRIASEYGLTLLEDNCESLGGKFDGKALGTFGFGGTFSTFFSHHISTMEGGLIATDDEEMYQVLKSVRAHGWTRDLPATNHVFDKTGESWDDLFRFVLPGYNLRPLEIEAAIGLQQLLKLPKIVSVRRENAKLFKKVMEEFPEMLIQEESGESSWFGFSLTLTGALRGKRKLLVESLNQFGVESRPVVAGNFTRNPVIKHLTHLPIPALDSADQIHHDSLFIGNHHYDLAEEINYLQQALKSFMFKAKMP